MMAQSEKPAITIQELLLSSLTLATRTTDGERK
jgi:hypothetical protein